MLSNEALALFRRHLELRRTVDLDANREAYRELTRAGLMVVGSSFAGGQDSVYHVTKEGLERKVELLAATSPLPDSAAALGADREIGLRGVLHRLRVLAARPEFLVLVGDDRVDPIPQPQLRPDASAFLALEQFGVQHAGIDHDASRVGTALAPNGSKWCQRPSPA